MRKKLILILSCILVVLIGAGAILGIVMLNSDSGNDKYRKKLSAANKYVQEENWEDAIVAYLDVIDLNKKSEDAYLRLAEIYLYQGDTDKAKAILEEGIANTGSQKIQEMYDKYFSEEAQASAESKTADTELALNTTLLGQIASYEYQNYTKKYGSANVSSSGGTSTVTHKNLDGVQFIYYNTGDNDTIVNERTGEPNDDKMPWEASFTDLSVLLSGVEDGVVSYDELSGLGVKSLKTEYDNTIDSNVVSFEASKCLITIACDEDGNVKTDAWNKVVPKYADNDSEDEETAEISATIVSATDGNGVANAQVDIYNSEDLDTVIQSVETDNSGSFSADLAVGEYVADVEKEGYINESINFEVNRLGELEISQFTISPELGEGEIRIVLEWGEYPWDLDSHLRGTDSNGDNVHVYYGNKREPAANLDVDDVDSYGPETTTVVDTNGEYEFYVIDFNSTGNISTSGATVKVYMPGQSAPRTYEVPSGLENTWQVFKIVNGEIVDY
jgi:hypothetical protein